MLWTNMKGTRVKLSKGEWKWNTAFIRDEVPDNSGMVTVAIADVITKVPVGDLQAIGEIPYYQKSPGELITKAVTALRRLDLSIDNHHTAQEVQNYMKQVFCKYLPQGFMKVWSLAYFVTEEYSLTVAQRILDQNKYNVQRFGFNLLQETLKEYWSHQNKYPVTCPEPKIEKQEE